MTEQLTIGAVMTPFALEVEIDAPLRTAVDLMFDHEVRHLAVVESGELVGVVSDRDMAFVDNQPEAGLRDQLHVRSVCSLDIYSVEPSTGLAEVLSSMAELHIGSALVCESGKIVGIFTATDACRCFAEHLRANA
jgi:acetoin utilization protein AcuB